MKVYELQTEQKFFFLEKALRFVNFVVFLKEKEYSCSVERQQLDQWGGLEVEDSSDDGAEPGTEGTGVLSRGSSMARAGAIAGGDPRDFRADHGGEPVVVYRAPVVDPDARRRHLRGGPRRAAA